VSKVDKSLRGSDAIELAVIRKTAALTASIFIKGKGKCKLVPVLN